MSPSGTGLDKLIKSLNLVLHEDHVRKKKSQIIHWDREYNAHGLTASLNHSHDFRTPSKVDPANQTLHPLHIDLKDVAHQNEN